MSPRALLLLLMIVCSPPIQAGEPPSILVWGDSLSAAYGLPLEQGWVALLQRRLQAEGYPHQVINGSISGETTTGGLARLEAALRRNQPTLLLIELGANDGLRGLSLKAMRANLDAMLTQAAAAGARSLLFEMRIPSNYGAAYANGFTASFARVAADRQERLLPFFLQAFALDETQFQPDGIHPTAEAQPAMLDAVWQELVPLLAYRKPSLAPPEVATQ